MGADSEKFMDRLHSAMEQFKRKMTQEFSAQTKLALTPPQFYMLHLIRQQGKCKMTELADKMEVKPSAITVMIDRLVAHSLVERTHGERDRRVVFIELTERGRDVLAEMEQMRNRIVRRCLDKIEPHEAEQFLTILEKLVK